MDRGLLVGADLLRADLLRADLLSEGAMHRRRLIVGRSGILSATRAPVG